MSDKIYIAPNVTGPTECVRIDPEICIGCNACANVCRTQTILPNPVRGQPPVMVYPDECWYCACCVDACPTGALEMRHPIGRRILFKRKATGEVFRIGQKDPPGKSYFKPPFGEVSPAGSQDLRNAWISVNHKERHAVAILQGGDKAPEQIANVFRAKDGENVCGKVIAFLRLIGFEKVYCYDPEAPRAAYTNGDGESTDLILIHIGSDKAQQNIPLADAVLNENELISMMKRASVSMHTALYVWGGLQPSGFDPI